MGLRVLDDTEVRARLDARTATEAVRRALLAHHAGTLAAPARVRAPLGGGDLVVTAGRLREQGLFGFRAYDTLVDAEQLVAVWDETGQLRLVVHGEELGPRRTGAIGAVALDAMARPGALRLGLVGAGVQAWTQLWAVSAVRAVTEVAVWSRRRERAEGFARRAGEQLGVTVRVVERAEQAVRERDAVIVATKSTTPVVASEWLAPGTHLSTVGPKGPEAHEVPVELVERAEVLVTDSLAQAAGSLFPAGRLVELGAVLAGAAPGRTHADQISVFCSVGLAGTEVAVAAALVG
ncbi:ornithine cyclodeaminase family protein [Streptomyces orinoci]|uniref:Ornithine cyclodeaminase family protein n=1 Tax=Streptomyces orinoci TaxID=67339 RepID=A0ABV3JUA3_STRON|nr:ornithine cyclodeaminase family protein [Streptomyces orinoci]